VNKIKTGSKPDATTTLETKRPISPEARKLAAAIAEIYIPRLTKAQP
jgi:hypothetical protein